MKTTNKITSIDTLIAWVLKIAKKSIVCNDLEFINVETFESRNVYIIFGASKKGQSALQKITYEINDLNDETFWFTLHPVRIK
jgi:hypothetical protein